MNEPFRRLGLRTPIFGFSHCRDVVVAVSKAGGIGVYGTAVHSDRQIAIDLQWIEQQLGGQAYGVDILMPRKYVGSEAGGLTAAAEAAAVPAAVTEFLDDMMRRYEVPVVAVPDEDDAFARAGGQRYTAEEASAIVSLVLSFHPKLLVSGLGTPTPAVVKAAHDRGMLVGAMAGRVTHARRHVEAGVDLIIAQSYEAGGHTGDLGGMVLTPQIVDAVAPVPVLAAGGIADGRQMAAALALGAQGVWCGSVWLTTAESGCLPVLKQKLLAAKSEDTVRSRSLSGKPSRMLRSAWVEEWARAETPEPLAFPLQPIAAGHYLDRIEKAARGHATPDSGAGALITSPAGQVVGMMSAELSCRQVILGMMEGCVDAMAKADATLTDDYS